MIFLHYFIKYLWYIKKNRVTAVLYLKGCVDKKLIVYFRSKYKHSWIYNNQQLLSIKYQLVVRTCQRYQIGMLREYKDWLYDITGKEHLQLNTKLE